jgi:hypothetical protein
MSLRRLWVLVSRLPPDSHTGRALHGDIADWSLDTFLLARISNLLQQANAQRGGKRVPESQFIQPPASKAKAQANGQRQLTQAEFDALF